MDPLSIFFMVMLTLMVLFPLYILIAEHYKLYKTLTKTEPQNQPKQKSLEAHPVKSDGYFLESQKQSDDPYPLTVEQEKLPSLSHITISKNSSIIQKKENN